MLVEIHNIRGCLTHLLVQTCSDLSSKRINLDFDKIEIAGSSINPVGVTLSSSLSTLGDAHPSFRSESSTENTSTRLAFQVWYTGSVKKRGSYNVVKPSQYVKDRMALTLERTARPATADTSLNTSFSNNLTRNLVSRMFTPSPGGSEYGRFPSPGDRLTVVAGCEPIPGHGSCAPQPSSCGSCAPR